MNKKKVPAPTEHPGRRRGLAIRSWACAGTVQAGSSAARAGAGEVMRRPFEATRTGATYRGRAAYCTTSTRARLQAACCSHGDRIRWLAHRSQRTCTTTAAATYLRGLPSIHGSQLDGGRSFWSVPHSSLGKRNRPACGGRISVRRTARRTEYRGLALSCDGFLAPSAGQIPRTFLQIVVCWRVGVFPQANLRQHGIRNARNFSHLAQITGAQSR
jgi:hypothetical protein